VTTAPERRPLPFAGVEEILAALRGAGHRVSAPASQVIDALFEADGPVSAEHIAGRRPRLELTSVYRNLERLEALGVVSHVHVGHGPGLYALARGSDREYLTCDCCGRVTTVEPAALDEVRDVLHERFGHHARFSHFPIHGLCADCAQGGTMTPADHEHEHSHGDRVHSHPHTHEAGLKHEHQHDHPHDEE
jgi:Fur family ferric uptake transcriptional regulator